MGKESAPAAPDYTPIANADTTIANDQLQLGQEQLAFSQNQFNDVWPYAQQYLQQETSASQQENALAQQQANYYNTTFKPIETAFANTAANYNTPAQANQQAGAAQGDVANSFDAQRASSLQNLESYGIDPSQTRYGALDLGTRVSQAAATAAAGTQSRLNTQNTGLALQGEAVQMGQGTLNNATAAYSGAINAGSSGLGEANNTGALGTQGYTAASNTTGAAVNAENSEENALNLGYQDQLSGAEFEAQQTESADSGIGSLAGLALAAIAIA